MGNGQSEIFQKRFIDTVVVDATRKNVWRMYTAKTSNEISKLVDAEYEKLFKQEQQNNGSQPPPPIDLTNPMAPLVYSSTPSALSLTARSKISRAYTHPSQPNVPVTLLELNADHHFILSAKGGGHGTIAPDAGGGGGAADGGKKDSGASASPPAPQHLDRKYKAKYRPAIIAKQSLEWLMANPHHGCLPIIDVGCFGDTDIIAVTNATNLHPAVRVIHRHCSSEVLYGLSNIAEGLAHLHAAGICHRNIGWHSIVINGSTTQRYWQISEFQFAVNQRHVLQNGGGATWLCDFLSEIRTIKEAKMPGSVAPEDKNNLSAATATVEFFNKIPIGACDVFSFGQMIDAILPPPMLSANDKPMYPATYNKVVSPFGREDCSTGAIITSLRAFAKQCQHDDPMMRPKITDFLELPCVSRGVFTKIMRFCDHSVDKTQDERILFFNFLHLEMMKLPYELVVQRLVPRFLTIGLWRDSSAEPFLRHLLRPLQKFSSAETAHLFKVPMDPKILKSFQRAMSVRDEVEERERRRAREEAEAMAAKAEKGLEGTSATGGLKRGRRAKMIINMNEDGGDDIVPKKEGEGDAPAASSENATPAPEEEGAHVASPSESAVGGAAALDTWADAYIMEEIGVLNPQEFQKLVAKQLSQSLNANWVPNAPPPFLCLMLRQSEHFITAVDMGIIFDSLLPFTVASLMHSSADVSYEAMRSFSSLVSVIFNAHEKAIDTRDAIEVIRNAFDNQIFNLAAYERVPSIRNMALTVAGKTLHSSHKKRFMRRERAISALCVGLVDPLVADPKRGFIARVYGRRSLEILFKLREHLKPHEIAECVVPSLVLLIQRLTRAKNAMTAAAAAAGGGGSSSGDSGASSPSRLSSPPPQDAASDATTPSAAVKKKGSAKKGEEGAEEDNSPPMKILTAPPPLPSTPSPAECAESSLTDGNRVGADASSPPREQTNASAQPPLPSPPAASLLANQHQQQQQQPFANDPYIKRIHLEQKQRLYTIHHLLTEANKAFETLVVALRDAPDEDLKYKEALEEKIAAKKAQIMEKRRRDVDAQNKAAAAAAEAEGLAEPPAPIEVDETEPEVKLPPAPKRWSDAPQGPRPIGPKLVGVSMPSSVGGGDSEQRHRPSPKNPEWAIVGTFAPVKIPIYGQPSGAEEQFKHQERSPLLPPPTAAGAGGGCEGGEGGGGSQTPKECFFFSFDDYDNEWNNAPLFRLERLYASADADNAAAAGSAAGGGGGGGAASALPPINRAATMSTRLHPLGNKLPTRCGIITSASDTGDPLSRHHNSNSSGSGPRRAGGGDDGANAAGGGGLFAGLGGGGGKAKRKYRESKLPIGFDLVEKQLKAEKEKEKEGGEEEAAPASNPAVSAAVAVAAAPAGGGTRDGDGEAAPPIATSAQQPPAEVVSGDGGGGWGSAAANTSSFSTTANGWGDATAAAAGGGWGDATAGVSTGAETHDQQQQQPTPSSRNASFAAPTAAAGISNKPTASSSSAAIRHRSFSRHHADPEEGVKTNADDADAESTRFTWNAKPATPPPSVPSATEEEEGRGNGGEAPMQVGAAPGASAATAPAVPLPSGGGGGGKFAKASGGGIGRRKRMQVAEEADAEIPTSFVPTGHGSVRNTRNAAAASATAAANAFVWGSADGSAPSSSGVVTTYNAHGEFSATTTAHSAGIMGHTIPPTPSAAAVAPVNSAAAAAVRDAFDDFLFGPPAAAVQSPTPQTAAALLPPAPEGGNKAPRRRVLAGAPPQPQPQPPVAVAAPPVAAVNIAVDRPPVAIVAPPSPYTMAMMAQQQHKQPPMAANGDSDSEFEL